MSGALILIVDDDDAVTASLGLLLKQAGYPSVSARDPDAAMELLVGNDVRLVLQDMNFSRQTTGEEGLRLLGRIREAEPDLPVILITAWGSVELAVRGMRAGASDFITKPWSNEQVLQSVRTALTLAASLLPEESHHATREDLDELYDLEGIVGENARMLEILDLVGRVSRTDASVLISGDSGTGKEVIAAAIHRNSPRLDGPFVKVNLGGISSTLFESEMFGHVRGAFTDAHRDRKGRFAVADGGTILLDEIGELDLRSQVKMLRVLQDRTYEILGASETRTLDVRVIAATNRNLQHAVEEGGFREDLLYRINLISVHLPALCDRRDDIPRLARHFVQRAAPRYVDRPVEIDEGALRWLQAQEWPGNVRQLKHLIERTLLVTGSDRLEAGLFRRTQEMDGEDTARGTLPPVGSMTMDDIEKSMILKSLRHHEGNISRVAESLGMSRAALYRRMEKYGIRP